MKAATFRTWMRGNAKPLRALLQNFPGSGVRPCGWTVSIDYFDRLLGVLIFELRGASFAEVARRHEVSRGFIVELAATVI